MAVRHQEATARPDGGAWRGAPSPGRAERWLPDVAILCLVFVVAVVTTVPLGNIPQNDDWVYGIAVRALLETGRYTMPTPSSANAIAHVYWGALFCLPFGFSFEAVRLSTVVLALGGVAATYTLLRECGADRRTALAATGCVALNPVVIALSVTFMTDIPFLTLVTTALWLHVRGAVRQDGRAAAGAVLVVLLAMLVRQFAIAVLVGFAVSIVMRRGFRPGPIVAAAASVAAGLAIHFAFTRWMVATGRTPLVVITIEGMLSGSLFGFARRIVHLAAMSWLGIGFMVLPVLLVISGGRITALLGGWRAPVAWATSGAMAALCIAILAANGETMPVPHGTMNDYGIGPLLLRDVSVLQTNSPPIPAAMSAIWWIVTVAAAWSGAILVLMVARRTIEAGRAVLRGRMAEFWIDGLMLATAATALVTTMLAGWIALYADRYNLMLIAPLAVLAWRAADGPPRPRPWAWPAAIALLVTVGAFGVASTHDFLAWSRARWQVTDGLLASGATPEQIDGGYEFNGWLLALRSRAPVVPGTNRSYWWVVDDEYIVAMGPLPGYRLVSTTPVGTWLPFGGTHVSVLRREPARP